MAYVDETDPIRNPLLYPPPTDDRRNARDGLDATAWQVYDSVHGKWKAAPGNHCPAFSLQSNDNTGENMRGYIQKAIDDQGTIRKRVENMLAGAVDQQQSFAEFLEVTMTARAGQSGRVPERPGRGS